MIVVYFFENDGEFITAEPTDGVAQAQSAFQARGHRLQQLIAQRVSKPVIHRFEVIQIHVQKDHLSTTPSGQCDRMFKAIEHQQTVWQACQRIVVRLMANHLLVVFPVCHIVQAEHPPDDHVILQLGDRRHLEKTSITHGNQFLSLGVAVFNNRSQTLHGLRT